MARPNAITDQMAGRKGTYTLAGIFFFAGVLGGILFLAFPGQNEVNDLGNTTSHHPRALPSRHTPMDRASADARQTSSHDMGTTLNADRTERARSLAASLQPIISGAGNIDAHMLMKLGVPADSCLPAKDVLVHFQNHCINFVIERAPRRITVGTDSVTYIGLDSSAFEELIDEASLELPHEIPQDCKELILAMLERWMLASFGGHLTLSAEECGMKHGYFQFALTKPDGETFSRGYPKSVFQQRFPGIRFE